jgi:hypothetical protein
MTNRPRTILAGVVGGFAGALIMSLGIKASDRLGQTYRPLPLLLEQKIERQTGMIPQTGRRRAKSIAPLEHFALGMLFGAVFGGMKSFVRIPAVAGGLLYGLAIYVLNLGGITSAIKLTRGAGREEPASVIRRVVIHLMYGLTLGVVSSQMGQRDN